MQASTTTQTTETDSAPADTGGPVAERTAAAAQTSTTAAHRPLLLLDVDGVLNAFPTGAGRWDYTDCVIDGYPIHFHQELPQMVAELRRHFDIVWFTLWNRNAAPLIGPHVGLTDAPFLPTSWERGAAILQEQGVSPEEVRLFMFAKSPLLPGSVDPSRPWVWIDDAHSDWDWAYLKSQGFDPDRFRLIRTVAEAGLTWTEVQQAVGAARAWADGPSAVGAGADLPVDAITTGAAMAPGEVPGRSESARW